MAKSEKSRYQSSGGSKIRNEMDGTGLSRRASRNRLTNPDAPAVPRRGAIGLAVPGSATGGAARCCPVGRPKTGTQHGRGAANAARGYPSAEGVSSPPPVGEKSNFDAGLPAGSWGGWMNLDFEVESARDRRLVERLLGSMQAHGTGKVMRSAVIATLRDCLGRRDRGPADADFRRP